MTDTDTGKAQDEKRAPVQGYSAGIPWSMHLRAYDVYCAKHRPQPALIEGWCRGGFAVNELDDFIPGWREELSEMTRLAAALEACQAENVRLREALEKIGDCSIAGYCISGKNTHQKALGLVASFYKEMQCRVQIARTALAKPAQ